MIKDIVMKQACGVDHLTHKCYLPLLLLYLEEQDKSEFELNYQGSLLHTLSFVYLCMILQRCC